MSSQGVLPNGGAPTWGDLVEKWACDEFDLEYEDEPHYDATRPDGTRVEVKGAQVWIQNGTNAYGDPARCRGRFKLWEGSHANLAEDDGDYLLVIYDEDDDADCGINVLAWQWMKPETLTEVSGDCWYDVRSNPRTRTKGDPYRLSWAKVFDKAEVEA